MNQEKKKQPYTPPQITRVVLRKEQAILSQCSAAFTSAATTGNKCIAGGCRRSTSGTKDRNIVS